MPEPRLLHNWLQAADEKIRDRYDELHTAAQRPNRVQRVGHQAEHVWGPLLKEWLPPQYEVVYRRYIVPEVGEDSFTSKETDIVVLRPGYPAALRGESEILASGVAAAFSIKLTLDYRGLRDAAQEAASMRRHTGIRRGTPRRETTLPFHYGLLAHAHRFNTQPMMARERVSRVWKGADRAFSNHPRESLDLLCVANLGTWSKRTHTWQRFPEMAFVLNVRDLPLDIPEGTADADLPTLAANANWVTTSFLEQGTTGNPQYFSDLDEWQESDLSPLSAFISELYSRLAQEDDVADPFYRGLVGSRLTASPQGPSRLWNPREVYSTTVLDALPHRAVTWDDPEWRPSY